MFHYNVESHLKIPIKAKSIKSAKRKIEKLFKKRIKYNLVKDYSIFIDIFECEDFITDENGNVIEEGKE